MIAGDSNKETILLSFFGNPSDTGWPGEKKKKIKNGI